MPHTSLQQHRSADQRLRANEHENDEDEDLVLFQELQKRERAEIHESMALPLHQRIPAAVPPKSAGNDVFSSSEWDKHDYDWLMTPPVTSFLSSLEQKVSAGNGFSRDGSATVKNTPTRIAKTGSSELDTPRANKPLARAARRSFDIHKPADPNVALATSTSSVSRKSAATRSSTPSCSSTPVSLPIAKPSTASKSVPSSASVRSSTPTSLAVSSSNRSSTSVSQPSARSSTPSKSVPASASAHSSMPRGWVASPSNRTVSTTRPLTPIKRPATPTRVNGPSPASLKPSSVNKTSPLPAKSVSSMRPSCPATRARLPATDSAALSEVPKESLTNVQSSASDRSISNPRGSLALGYNASIAAVKATQLRPAGVGSRDRGSSSSPMVTRGCVSSDSSDREKAALRHGKLPDAAMISISHGVGSKTVGKITPPRKPLPLSQERTHFVVNTPARKTVQPTLPRDKKSTSMVRESSGFGRNLSRKSLDMALRHMDIRGSTPNGVESFMSNVPTSSLYSVRARNGRGISNGHRNQTSSIMSSPIATSSNASSEHSMSIAIDLESSELGDETSSSRASPVSQPDPSMALSNDTKVSHWLGSPGYMSDNGADLLKNFEQELASASGTASPLVSQPEGNIDCDDFILEPIQ